MFAGADVWRRFHIIDTPLTTASYDSSLNRPSHRDCKIADLGLISHMLLHRQSHEQLSVLSVECLGKYKFYKARVDVCGLHCYFSTFFFPTILTVDRTQSLICIR